MNHHPSRWSRFCKLVGRALCLRCPLCGQGTLFQGWRPRATCESCQASLEREPGFYLGSIYFNYGLTAIIVAIGYPVALFNAWLPERTLLLASLAFTVLFPIWFFRYARALWAGFDQWVDPRPGES